MFGRVINIDDFEEKPSKFPLQLTRCLGATLTLASAQDRAASVSLAGHPRGSRSLWTQRDTVTHPS